MQKCEKHACDLKCMAGRNAHASNWYCPKCDKEAEEVQGKAEAKLAKPKRDSEHFIELMLLYDTTDSEELINAMKDDISQISKEFTITKI